MQANRQIKEIIGSNIQRQRLAKDMSRRTLAEKVGVDQMLVYKWERGLHRPADHNLAAVAVKLGRELAWFYVDRGPFDATKNGKKAA